MLFPRWGREVRYGEEQGGHRCYIVKSLLVRGHIARSPTTALLCFALLRRVGGYQGPGTLGGLLDCQAPKTRFLIARPRMCPLKMPL